MNEKGPETIQLLQNWHAGDSKSLELLLERHLPWLRNQVHRRLGPALRAKGETCDYVQDAAIEFLRYGPRFMVSDDQHFRALLFRIVENTLRNKHDWFVARRREIARERPLPATTILSLDPALASRKTPSMSVERHEREAWVRLGVELLDAKDREVLVMRQWQNMSINEMAERLEISVSAAQMRYSRALRRLAAKIGELRRLKPLDDPGGEQV